MRKREEAAGGAAAGSWQPFASEEQARRPPDLHHFKGQKGTFRFVFSAKEKKLPLEADRLLNPVEPVFIPLLPENYQKKT